MQINPALIHKICDKFEKESTQDLLQAMVVELKKDARKDSRHADFYIQLSAQIQDQNFWENMEYLLDFTFDY